MASAGRRSVYSAPRMAKRSYRRPPPPDAPSPEAPAPLPTWRQVLLDVGVPFAVSRCLLLLLAWLFAEQPRGVTWIPKFAERGWGYTTQHWLDVWARWDSSWYLDIVRLGYQPGGYAIGEYSSIAFFPIYPQAVRLLYRLLPTAWQGETAALALAVLIAHLCALGALAVLYWHVRVRFGERTLAQRSVLFLLAFPTAFFLGCVYTESTFLLLAVAAYHMAWRRRWAAAAVLGALLSATRSNGVLIVLPFLWMQLEDAGWKLGRLDKRALWLLLVPAGFLAYAAYLWQMTGDWGAIVVAQRAWRKELATPFALFGPPPTPYGDLVHIDRLLTLAFAAAAVWLTTRRGWRSDGLVVAVFLAAYLFTGTPISASRYVLVAFPVFVWLAGRASEGLRQAYLGSALALQAALWIMWVLMRWVA
jgi:hypothetical protein